MDGESVADVHIVNNKITMHNQFQGSLYGIYVNRLQHVIIAGNSVSNFGKGGIQLLAVSYSTVFSNQVFNNGRSSKGAGIQLLQWNSSMGSSFNVVQNNSVYDDQSTPTQVTSIQITTGAQTNNRVVGNTTQSIRSMRRLHFSDLLSTPSSMQGVAFIPDMRGHNVVKTEKVRNANMSLLLSECIIAKQSCRGVFTVVRNVLSLTTQSR